MKTIQVEIKLLSSTAQPPEFAHQGDACADIRSDETTTIGPGETKLIGTGVAMSIPEGFEAQIRPRSGLAAKHSISIVNSPGTIDSGYRGEVKIILVNLGHKDFEVSKGDRIAQVAIREVPAINYITVEELSETNRGEGGFGSTGIH
ncbi:MAG: dUTP diphosphatase [Candidatus Heimdallarchaeota archaeon]|nr:dUTP diphosphatase [Candidatus Heimdallarchaeota archaeon]